MKKHSLRLGWIALLLGATLLRLPFPDWDGGIAAHPDERFLLGVAQETPLWGDVCAVSPDFAYGHLPVYLARLLVLTAPQADPLYAARLLSGLIGVLLVALAGAYGRMLGGERAGLCAAALMTFAPFPIQQARFYTVDPLGATLASGAILAAMRKRWSTAGALAGLALACKASLGWAAVVVAVGYGLAGSRGAGERGSGGVRITHYALRFTHYVLRITRYVFLPMLIAFILASPWLVLRPVTCWRGAWIQAGMVAGRYDFPYTRQYAGTWPYVYPLAQMALWGLGPLATLIGMIGLARALWRWRTASLAARVAALWTLVYFLATAGLAVKFPRYLLPIYPVWAAWAVASCGLGVRRRWVGGWVGEWVSGWVGGWVGGSLNGEKPSTPHASHLMPHASRLTPYASLLTPYSLLLTPYSLLLTPYSLLTLVSTALLGLAQVSVYTTPHPWMRASQWVYENVAPGATVAVEMWDHPLPVPLPGGDPAQYRQITLPVFDDESPEKAAQLAGARQEAEGIVLASRRGYGALARLPKRYAETLTWYRDLLTERSVVAFGRCPRLGPLALSDDPLADAGLPTPRSLAERCGTRYALRLPRLDESFRVYDAPGVLVVEK